MTNAIIYRNRSVYHFSGLFFIYNNFFPMQTREEESFQLCTPFSLIVIGDRRRRRKIVNKNQNYLHSYKSVIITSHLSFWLQYYAFAFRYYLCAYCESVVHGLFRRSTEFSAIALEFFDLIQQLYYGI